jgi:hypothetical protein
MTDALGFKLDEDSLRLVMLQDEKVIEYKAKTWSCKGEAPKPFDLCLELRGKDGVIKMYSGLDWEVRPKDQNEKLPPLVRGFANTVPEGALDASSER